MPDDRLNRLAEILIDHSCQLTPGDKVLIEAYDLPDAVLSAGWSNWPPSVALIRW